MLPVTLGYDHVRIRKGRVYRENYYIALNNIWECFLSWVKFHKICDENVFEKCVTSVMWLLYTNNFYEGKFFIFSTGLKVYKLINDIR